MNELAFLEDDFWLGVIWTTEQQHHPADIGGDKTLTGNDEMPLEPGDCDSS